MNRTKSEVARGFFLRSSPNCKVDLVLLEITKIHRMREISKHFSS